jgi:hypothetical protein
MLAIDHANRILSWQENLTSDEMPERWKWHLDWEIEEHFKILKIKREEKYSSSSSALSDDDDTSPIEWEENAYSARFK